MKYLGTINNKQKWKKAINIQETQVSDPTNGLVFCQFLDQDNAKMLDFLEPEIENMVKRSYILLFYIQIQNTALSFSYRGSWLMDWQPMDQD